MSTKEENKEVVNDCTEVILDGFVSSQPTMIDLINGFIGDIVELRDNLITQYEEAFALTSEIVSLGKKDTDIYKKCLEEAVSKKCFADKLTDIIESYGK